MPKTTIFNAIFFIFAFTILHSLSAQDDDQGVHQRSSGYIAPKDSKVLAKLDKWKDQKFGMHIHWGIYSVPGIMESWNLCSEDWIERDSTITYNDYKKWYWNLNKIFNPVLFTALRPLMIIKMGMSVLLKMEIDYLPLR